MLCGRVVTMAESAGPAGRRSGGVVVAAGAVVTPAVRDELHRRRIGLVRADPQSAAAATRPAVVIVVGGPPFDPPVCWSGPRPRGLSRSSRGTSDCLIAATDQLASEVAKPDTLGVLLTRHAAAALCLANRHAGVRAVRGTGPDAAVAADGRGRRGRTCWWSIRGGGTFFQLKQMVDEFCRGGVSRRAVPEVFSGTTDASR